jgi:hypothetical protein
MEEEIVPLDKLVKIYRKLRARMTLLTQEYDTQAEVLKAQQDEIKNAIKDQMKAMGVTSVRTAEGTAVMSVKTRYTTQDWDEFKKFMLEHEALDLLEKRIAQTNMAQFLEENPGVVPPGLNSSSEYDISVRKPT